MDFDEFELRSHESHNFLLNFSIQLKPNLKSQKSSTPNPSLLYSVRLYFYVGPLSLWYCHLYSSVLELFMVITSVSLQLVKIILIDALNIPFFP